MARKFTSGFKPKSTTKEAKKIIREEMLSYFDPSEYSGAKTPLDAMKQDADAGNGGVYGKKYVSDYQKGAHLVDSASLAVAIVHEIFVVTIFVIAITAITGALIKTVIPIAITFWTWTTSFVVLVIKLGVEKCLISALEKSITFS